jgi:hypothetical protein
MASYEEIKRKVAARHQAAEIGTRARFALLASIGVTLLLYFVPYGHIVATPLVWLSTLAHELGHGITALLLGGRFEQFVMFPDASGMASYSGSFGPLGRALVAAGGLVGPAVVAAFGFALARRDDFARITLVVMAALLLVAEILVVRNGFALAFVGILAVTLAVLAFVGDKRVSQMTLVFVSTQLSMAIFSRADYLFTDTAQTGAGVAPSDVAQMADALFGPYWLWGALCGAFSVAVLGVGAWLFLFGLRVPSFGRKRPRVSS